MNRRFIGLALSLILIMTEFSTPVLADGDEVPSFSAEDMTLNETPDEGFIVGEESPVIDEEASSKTEDYQDDIPTELQIFSEEQDGQNEQAPASGISNTAPESESHEYSGIADDEVSIENDQFVEEIEDKSEDENLDESEMVEESLMMDTETVVASGLCGDSGSEVTWELVGENENLLLRIQGSGRICDYNNYDTVPWYSYRASIKQVIILEGVINIGNYAFYNCSSLTSVTIPEGVTSIGSYAFYRCSGLTSVTIPEGVTSIGRCTFYGCSELTSVTIPEGVTTLEVGLFSCCSSLKNVLLPDSVIIIKGSDYTGSQSNGTFYYCKSLKSVTIPYGITRIDNDTFIGCSALTEINLPDSLESIGDRALSDCSSLTSITIPEGVTSIGNSAFYKCSSLTSIIIPEGVTSIGTFTFSGCSSLTSATIPEGVTSIERNAFSGCGALTSVTIPGCVTSIGSSAFYNCSSLTSITIPEGVTSIGDSTFYGCSGLTSITIPEGVTSIGYSTFYGCSGLTSITIPEGVTSIGDSAFYNCSRLTSVMIPEGVSSIGQSVFRGCTRLTSVTIPEGVTSIGDSAFYNCSRLTSVTIPEGVTSIGKYAFYGCSGLPSVTIPEGVTSIKDYTFDNCSGLTSITIPESITSIGNQAFYGCSALTDYHIASARAWLSFIGRLQSSINKNSKHLFIDGIEVTEFIIPEEVSNIGDYAFYNCSCLTNVTIPENVKSIGNYAFYGCSGLTSVTIPEGVISIGGGAFSGCSNLQAVIITEPWPLMGTNAFAGTPWWENGVSTNGECGDNLSWVFSSEGDRKRLTISGYGAMMDYGADGAPWCSYGITEVVIEEGVTSIGNYAFKECSSLTSISIPEGIMSVGRYSFSGCTNLQNITIPNSTTSIGASVFNNCTGLKSITISKGVTSIGASAFSNCTGLKSITIPEGVTSIENYTFYKCNNLASVCIPDTVTSIGESAFYDCKGLKRIRLPINVTTIGQYAFYYCNQLENVIIPKGITNIKFCTFAGCSTLKSVVIPLSVLSFSSNSFSGCSKIETVYYEGSSDEWNCINNRPSSFNNKVRYNSYDFTMLLSPQSFQLSIDKSFRITVKGVPTGGTVYWSSQNKEVANIQTALSSAGISSASTVVSSKSYGDTIITAEYGGSKTECSVTVGDLKINQEEILLLKGQSTDLAVDQYSPDNLLEKFNINWISSDDNVVSVDSEGHLTAKTCGTAVVTATIGEIKDSCTINVIGVSLGEESIVLNKGAIRDLPEVLFDPVDLTEEVEWTSSDSNIVLITEEGKIKAISNGMANLIATSSVGELHCSVMVITPLEKITLAKESLNLEKGTQIKCPDVFYTPFDTTERDVRWESSNPDVLTVSEDGILSGISNGTAELKAIAGDKEAVCEVTVVTYPESITFPLDKVDIPINTTLSLPEVDFLPEDTTETQLEWSSSDETILIIENNEIVTKKAGTARVTATTINGLAASFDVTVLSGYSNIQKVGDYAWAGLTGSSDNYKMTIFGSGPVDLKIDYWQSAFRTGIKQIVIEDGITSLCDNVFYTVLPNVTSVSFPESLESIGVSAFKGFSGITSLDIPDGVSILGDHSFQNCSSLERVVLSESLETISAYAFNGCTSLDRVTIPDSVKSIGDNAFYGCTSLKSIFMPSDLETVGAYAFYNTGIGAEDFEIPDTVETIGDYAFANNKSLTEITVPAHADSIGIGILSGCTALESAEILSDLSELPKSTFTGCTALTNVQWSDTVSKIGEAAFKNCKSLSALEMPAAVQTIDKEAFSGCTGLKTVTVKGNRITIGDKAFYCCTNLTGITVNNGIDSLGESAFENCSKLTEMPKIGKAAVVPKNAFKGCSSLASLSAMPKATEIGESAFAGCTGLASADIPIGLTTIGQYAFNGCSNLKALSIPETVTGLGQYAFAGCTKLEEIDLPGSVAVISNYAFNGCTSLKTVKVKEGVATIGATSFSGCTSLASIYLPLSLTSINASAFSNGATGITAYYPGTQNEWEKINGHDNSALSVVFNYGAATAISFKESTMTLGIGITKELEIVGTPEGARIRPLIWESSNTKVASVDQNGVLTTVKAGSVRIYVDSEDGELSTHCDIVVSNIPATALSFENDLYELSVGETINLTVVSEPANANLQTYTWESQNPAVVTVDENGLVTAVKNGTTTIKVTNAEGLSATCQVKVYKAVESLAFEAESLELKTGDTCQAPTISVTPSSGTIPRQATWTSSDETVVLVDENGLITAVGEGTANITAELGGKTASLPVTVSFDLSNMVKESVLLPIGSDESALTVAYTGENAETANKITWTSLDPAVVSVDDNGLMTANTKGYSVITAEVTGGQKALCEVRVYQALKTLEIKAAANRVVVGNTDQISIVRTPSDADLLNEYWTSSDTSVATVDENGLVTGISEGIVEIVLHTTEADASCTIEVYRIPLTGIKLNYSDLTLVKGEGSKQLLVTCYPSNTTDNREVCWESSDESIVSVNQNGLISLKNTGSAIISATVGSFTKQCSVTVVDSLPLAFDQDVFIVYEGNTVNLLPKLTPTGEARLCRWTSSAAAVSVTNNGLCTGMGKGIATVRASYEDQETLCTVVVLERPDYSSSYLTLSNYILNNGTAKVENGKIYRSISKTLTSSDFTIKIWITTLDGESLDFRYQVNNKAETKSWFARMLLKKDDLAVIPVEANHYNTSVLPATFIYAYPDDNSIAASSFEGSIDWVMEYPTDAKKQLFTSTFNDGMEAWGILTREKADVSLYDLGFTAYNVVKPTAMSLSKHDMNLDLDAEEELDIVFTPEDTSDKSVNWMSEDPQIAEVDSEGVVKGIKSGETRVFAVSVDGSLYDRCSVKVLNPKPSSIKLKKSELTLKAGQEESLTFDIVPQNASYTSLSWKSSDKSVVTVDKNGKVKGVKIGTAQITVTVDDSVSAKCQVTVLPADDATRLYGSNRYSTSLAIANQLKKQLSVSKFDAIVLATGADYPDALAGGYLASLKNAPIVLIRADKPVSHKDNKMVASWIKSNLKSGGTIYVLGSTDAVSNTHVNAVKSGFKVSRLGGKNRFGTDLEILKACGVKSGKKTFIVTTGYDYADALCASALSYPLLIVNTKKNIITKEQESYLNNVKGSTFYILGPTSVVSSSIEKALKSYGTVKRVSTNGSAITRSVQTARQFTPKPKAAALAISTAFADGLCGGVLANKMGASLLLVKSGSESQAAAFVKEKAVTSSIVFGSSSGAVPDKSVKKVFPGLKTIVTAEYK